MQVTVNKSSIAGSISIPGSKSHTLRAVLISALAEGQSVIDNPLSCNDTRSAINAATRFGAKCDTQRGDGRWYITGTSGRPAVPDDIVDCGNSGGTTYFSTAIAATVPGCSVISGDQQIRKRPIKRLLNAINELGGEAFATRSDVDAAPVVVKGPIKGGTCHFDGLLSSYITGMLLAAPSVENDTEILVQDPKETPYLRMTLDWLRRQGIQVEADENYRRMLVRGGQRYRPVRSTIPGDWSSAAFPLAAAVITGSEYALTCVDFQDTQGDKEIVSILRLMGADIEIDNDGKRLLVHPCSALRGGMEINMEDIPDALPALSVVAAAARGKTVFTGVENVRLKETDRVSVMCSELSKMGVRVEADDHSMTVYGGEGLHGALVDSYGDHRVAMALIVAGMIAEGTTTVLNAESVDVSYPGFISGMVASGANISC